MTQNHHTWFTNREQRYEAYWSGFPKNTSSLTKPELKRRAPGGHPSIPPSWQLKTLKSHKSVWDNWVNHVCNSITWALFSFINSSKIRAPEVNYSPMFTERLSINLKRTFAFMGYAVGAVNILSFSFLLLVQILVMSAVFPALWIENTCTDQYSTCTVNGLSFPQSLRKCNSKPAGVSSQSPIKLN